MGITELGVNNFLRPDVLGELTFGRDTTRFHQLVEFLTFVSIVLWMCVALTAVLSVVYVAWHRYRRRAGGDDGRT